MPIAAVPAYLGKDFSAASPGMRFGMYLQLWNESVWSKIKEKPLDKAKELNANDRQTMRGLLERQRLAFDVSALAEASFRLDALATAPFTTGLGNEHPTENGFAFLNPYGLPYLPGSSVKGVLRQAACELASGQWGETHGWSDEKRFSLPSPASGRGAGGEGFSMLDVLFGPKSNDGDTDHLRGALSFWDVIPQIAPEDSKKPDQISLAVEIMTPHQGHYYQNGEAPHESGQPNPISFLSVPPNSRFVFHVQCNLAFLGRLAPELNQGSRWKEMLEAAFQHAYQWLGFGAKTAVGYGAMKENPEARVEREKQQADSLVEAKRQAEEARRATLSPDDLAWEEHRPIVDAFRLQFEAANQTPYKPGSQFDNQRNEFMKVASAWEDAASRQTAGELLKATMTKAWGTPGNKDSKQRLKDAVSLLSPDAA